MQIHLSKPGGLREGPYTLEEINRDLAAKKYNDTDYWAWYEGLGEWVPLHSIPGVATKAAVAAAAKVVAPLPTPPSAERNPAPTPAPSPAPTRSQPAEPSGPAPAQKQNAPPSLKQQLSSGLPFDALEHIFVLTTGEGQTGSRSTVTAGVMESVTGESLDTIRRSVRRDVVGKCEFLEQLRSGGAMPDTVWRALANLNAELVKNARAGSHKICVRTFPIENKDLVTLLLFYRKPSP